MTNGADPETRRIRLQLRLAAADGLTSVKLSPHDERTCLDGCTFLASRTACGSTGRLEPMLLAAVSGNDRL